jgi:hypothetical protein
MTFFICPGGGIGRHAGLKILYPLKMCGFKSRPGYQGLKARSIVRVLPIAIGTASVAKVFGWD